MSVTQLCDLLGIKVPVMQAGMGMPDGLLTSPELVAGVSNAGGMGCIGGTGLDPQALRAVIRETRALTDKPFGVDILLPAKLSTDHGNREAIRQQIQDDFPERWRFFESLHERFDLVPTKSLREFSVTEELTEAQCDVVFDEGVPLLVTALGDSDAVVRRAHEAGTKVAGMVGSARHAERQLRSGVDILIAQGAEAGGHTGTIGSLVLLPSVVEVARSSNVPVVAAGGIGSGDALVAAVMLGASAVWCGTAFLFSREVLLSDFQREQLREASPTMFVRSRAYTGKPSRMYRNAVVKAWDESGIEPLPMPHQRILMDDFAEAARAAGRFDLVSNPGGQVAGQLGGDPIPAAEIVERMIQEARDCLVRAHADPWLSQL